MSKTTWVSGIFVIIVVAGLVVFLRQTTGTNPPPTLVLPVPFSPQAPNNNWDRNEDCEETSITMANAFLTGNHIDKLPADAAQESIDTLKKWENANIGYNINTGVEATTKMAEGAFGLKVEQIQDYTEANLKQALADNHPVLLPINARLLGNPKYQDTGPLYHMIVVRGYNEQGFVVNDPGTESGNRNVYSFSVLKNAAADWDQPSKSMDAQRKFALILSRGD